MLTKSILENVITWVVITSNYYALEFAKLNFMNFIQTLFASFGQNSEIFLGATN